MRSVRARLGVCMLVALAALTVVGTASAAKADPNLWLHVLPSPRTPLADATVTVTDATGRVVGRGETTGVGVALLHVETGAGVTRPYTVKTTGGTTDGVPFTGHVELRTWRASLRGGAQSMNMVTTAAVRYVDAHGGRIADAERRIFKGLGLSERFGHIHLKHSSRTVDRRTLNHHHGRNGGFNGTVAVLVQALEGTGAYPDFSSTRHEKPRSVVRTSTRASGGLDVPCGVQVQKAPSDVTNVAVTAASVQMIAGIASGFMTKDPSLFLNGAIGMAMAETPGSTVGSMMASIEKQLACISGQIAALQVSIDKQSEALALVSAGSCEAAITGLWNNEYQVLLQTIADNPKDPQLGYYKTNAMIDQLADDIEDQVKPCAGIINQSLFNGQNGQIAAWSQLLSNYRSGDYRDNDKVALSQESVVELQQFLQYWGNLMYMQTILVNEYYNIRLQFDKMNMAAFQQAAMVSSTSPCPTTPSPANVQPNATTGCQWQQNIANVWPGDVYTDEVLYYKNTKQSSPFGISGWGFSAVPVAWGMPSSTTSTAINLITPKYLHDKEIDKYDSRWNAQNAGTFFNKLPATDIGGLNQSIYFRRGAGADLSNTPWCNGNCGNAYPNLSVYGPFFSKWLNSPKPDPVNGSYATVNLAPGTGGPSWQVLAKDGTVVFDDNRDCGLNGAGDQRAYAQYTSHNTIYSPKPWTANSGGTIGGGPAGNGTDPCSVTVPIAFLKARGISQGASWPAAPIITSSGTVSSTATLAATGCPSGGCTWAISSPLSSDQSALQLSSGGTFSWPGATTGATATVQVIAGNNQTYSAPVMITVQAP